MEIGSCKFWSGRAQIANCTSPSYEGCLNWGECLQTLIFLLYWAVMLREKHPKGSPHTDGLCSSFRSASQSCYLSTAWGRVPYGGRQWKQEPVYVNIAMNLDTYSHLRTETQLLGWHRRGLTLVCHRADISRWSTDQNSKAMSDISVPFLTCLCLSLQRQKAKTFPPTQSSSTVVMSERRRQGLCAQCWILSECRRKSCLLHW